MKVITEEFPDISTLLRVISSRKNNEVMKNCHSSKDNDSDFTGTETWEEAIKLLRTGYSDILPEVKKSLRKLSKTNKKYSLVDKSVPKTSIVGYAPHVPNSLQNLPNSMIYKEMKPMKRKTISIFYSIDGNCNETTNFFIKTGTALVAAINIIENAGIQVKLSLGFITAEKGNETTFPTVVIKNYGQRFDLLKICFPIAHPSMLRRIGFKWLETTPDITESGFSWGYGADPEKLDNVQEELSKKYKDFYLLNTHWIRDHNYDVNEILKFLEFNK